MRNEAKFFWLEWERLGKRRAGKISLDLGLGLPLQGFWEPSQGCAWYYLRRNVTLETEGLDWIQGAQE